MELGEGKSKEQLAEPKSPLIGGGKELKAATHQVN